MASGYIIISEIMLSKALTELDPVPSLRTHISVDITENI